MVAQIFSNFFCTPVRTGFKNDIISQIDKIDKIYDGYGLSINNKKTEILSFNSNKKESINYLGICFSKNLKVDFQLENNYKKMMEFYMKYKYIFTGSVFIKIILIKSMLLRRMLYGLETLKGGITILRKYDRKLNILFKNILKLKLSFPNDILRFVMGIPSLYNIIELRKLRLSNKIMNMNNYILRNKLNILNVLEGVNMNKGIEIVYNKWIKDMENSDKWKVEEFINNWINFGKKSEKYKTKGFLKYDSGTLLKFIGYTNGLKRYNYVVDKDKINKMCDCGMGEEEDIIHFLYNCKMYKNIRKEYFKQLKLKLNKDEFKSIVYYREYCRLIYGKNEQVVRFVEYIKKCLAYRSIQKG